MPNPEIQLLSHLSSLLTELQKCLQHMTNNIEEFSAPNFLSLLYNVSKEVKARI